MKDHKSLHLLFENILLRHRGILHKVARLYCHHEDDREDLIQEMMIQLWRALPSYNDRFAITTWMYRIALNVAISFYRKNAYRKTNTVELVEHTSNKAEQPGKNEQEERLILLNRFIDELNDLDKALMLLYLEDKSHAEIASILGLSLTNVATKISRIKEKLKLKFSQNKSSL